VRICAGTGRALVERRSASSGEFVVIVSQVLSWKLRFASVTCTTENEEVYFKSACLLSAVPFITQYSARCELCHAPPFGGLMAHIYWAPL
jgi:hypothetical protein